MEVGIVKWFNNAKDLDLWVRWKVVMLMFLHIIQSLKWKGIAL